MQRFTRSATLCVFGVIGLVSVTFACYRLHFNVATAGFLYMIIVVLVSRIGDLVSSILVCIVAVLCLAYLAPPAFSFRVDDPLDVVAIIAFLSTSVVIARLVSKLRKMTDETLSSVHRKLIDAEERERARVARELHDDICQRMALVALGLEQLGGSSKSVVEVGSCVQELRQRVSEISTDLHAVSHRLHSSTLEYLGLATSAKTLCREFAKQQKVEIDFKSYDMPTVLPLEISLPLFRVLQEALSNSAKYSGERHFEVELFGTPGAIHLTVCDSGIGFDPKVAMQGSGLGLTSMRERLKLVHGEFSIDSQPQCGTKIHATAPLRSGSDARVG